MTTTRALTPESYYHSFTVLTDHPNTQHVPLDMKPHYTHSSQDGAHNKSACPSCLRRDPHNINNCIVKYLWDGTPTYARHTPEGTSSTPMETSYVMIGRSHKGAPNPTITASTFAPVVAAPPTVLKSALRWSHAMAITPYKVTAWLISFHKLA